MTVAGEIQEFLDAEGGNGQLKEERLALGKALAEVQGMLGILIGWLRRGAGRRDPRAVQGRPDSPADPARAGRPGRRLAAAAAGRGGAAGARPATVTDADKAFYEGKVAAARFFAREVLPRIGADRRIVENTTLDLMDLPEEAF